jgi:hypothetical protein
MFLGRQGCRFVPAQQGRTVGMKASRSTAAFAAAFLMSGPCLAAQDIGSADPSRAGVAAFAGGSIKLPLGGGAKARPVARLRLGTMRSAGPRAEFGQGGLELGLGAKGAPQIFIGGQSSAEVKRRLGVSGSTHTAVVVVFAVALIAVSALVLSDLDNLSQDD